MTTDRNELEIQGPRSRKPSPASAPIRGLAVPASQRRARDVTATADRILKAAIDEFAANGYDGARVDAIARRADANMRILYHYFESKNGLYVHVLKSVFEDIRLKEQRLNVRNLAPVPAMVKLFDFTYTHFASNSLFVRILMNENFLGCHHLKASTKVSAMSSPLVDAIRDALKRGVSEGAFRPDVDPLQVYVTIVALSYLHISNAATLSHLFDVNLASPRWRADRKRHARDMLLSYLTTGHPSLPSIT